MKEPLDEIGHAVDVSSKRPQPVFLSDAIYQSKAAPWLASSERWRQIGNARYVDPEKTTWESLYSEDTGKGMFCKQGTNTCSKHGLVCRDSMCTGCERDSDCPLHSVCSNDIQDVRRCVTSDLSIWEQAFYGKGKGYWILLGTIIIFITAVLAATAGVGGGGIFVPVLIILCGKAPSQAVPIAQVMIFTGSIINIVSFITQRHPDIPKNPVIDYNCIALLEPLLCTGVVLGVIAGQACPSWFLLLLLAITLLPAIQRTGAKGQKQWREEKARDERAGDESNRSGDRERGDVAEENRGCCASCCSMLKAPFFFDYKKFADGHIGSFVGIVKNNYLAMLSVFLVWILVFCIYMLWGRTLSVCSYEYLIFLSIAVASFVILTWAIGRFVVKIDKHDPVEREKAVDWSKAQYKYPVIGFIAGFLGGLLGLGGGVIMSPVLIEIGMHAEAVQATTATFVFISSSVATLQFFILDVYLFEEVVWYCTATFTATAIGQWIFGAWIRKTKRYSLITLSIAGILLLSLIALSVIGSIQTYRDWDDKGAMEFHFENVCGGTENAETILAFGTMPT